MTIDRRTTCSCVACVLLTLLAAQLAWGYEGYIAPVYEIPMTRQTLTGARSLGMGGAALAVAEDASALSANPAALARMRRVELAGGLSRNTNDLSGTAFGDDFETSLSRTRFSSVRFAYPFPTFRGSLVMGISGDRVQDFEGDFVATYEDVIPWWVIDDGDTVDYTGSWRQAEDSITEGGIYAWTLGAAFDASPGVSLGIALSYWRGDFTRRFRWTAEYVDDLPTPPYDAAIWRMDSDTDVSGFRAKVGGLFYVNEALAMALVVESPITLTFDGLVDTTFTAVGDVMKDESGRAYISDEITLPFSFSAGVAYSPTDLVMLAADVYYTDWSEMTYAGRVYAGDPAERQAAYEATTDLRLGVEVTLPSWPVRLRGGYMSRPLAYRGNEFGILGIDEDRSYFTLGAGFLVDTVLAIDVAWLTGAYERSGEDYDYNEAVDESGLVLEVTYRF
jgi:long-subunit fatty acid transport protein